MYDKLNNLLILLCRTISTRKLYFAEHPKVKELSTECIKQLRAFCHEARLEKLFIGIVDGNLVFEGKNLVGPSIVGRQLVLFAEKLHCGGFSFTDATSTREFNAFLDLTLELKKPTESLKVSRDLLLKKDIHSIESQAHRSHVERSGIHLAWPGFSEFIAIAHPHLSGTVRCGRPSSWRCRRRQ